MPNGFTSPGGFRQNRRSASSYSIPWSSAAFIPMVYKTRQTQSDFAFVILQNGNHQSNRIRNFNTNRK